MPAPCRCTGATSASRRVAPAGRCALPGRWGGEELRDKGAGPRLPRCRLRARCPRRGGSPPARPQLVPSSPRGGCSAAVGLPRVGFRKTSSLAPCLAAACRVRPCSSRGHPRAARVRALPGWDRGRWRRVGLSSVLLNVFFEAVVHVQCRDSAVIQTGRKAKEKSNNHVCSDR